MAKKYKLWVSVEEIDEEADTYKDLAEAGYMLPVQVGVFTEVGEAADAAEALSNHYSGETLHYWREKRAGK